MRPERIEADQPRPAAPAAPRRPKPPRGQSESRSARRRRPPPAKGGRAGRTRCSLSDRYSNCRAQAAVCAGPVFARIAGALNGIEMRVTRAKRVSPTPHGFTVRDPGGNLVDVAQHVHSPRGRGSTGISPPRCWRPIGLGERRSSEHATRCPRRPPSRARLVVGEAGWCVALGLHAPQTAGREPRLRR